MRGAALALTLGLMASAASAIPGLEPGVSRELARWRARQYHDVRYALALHIAAGAAKLEGTATIELTLPDDTPDMVLDWRPPPGAAAVRELSVNGKRAQSRLEREHLIVPARFLRMGRNRVILRFESPIAASGSAVTRYTDRDDGSEYVYTLLVPSDASSVFPCFDQPDLKGRFSLELTVPRGWTAVANALRRPFRSAPISSPSPQDRSQSSPRPRAPRAFGCASRALHAPARRRRRCCGSTARRCSGSRATSGSAFRFPSTTWSSSPSSPTAAWSTRGRPSCARTRCCFLPRRTKPTSSRARSSSFTRPRTSGSAIW